MKAIAGGAKLANIWIRIIVLTRRACCPRERMVEGRSNGTSRGRPARLPRCVG